MMRTMAHPGGVPDHRRDRNLDADVGEEREPEGDDEG
jgi:hypothetical protein